MGHHIAPTAKGKSNQTPTDNEPEAAIKLAMAGFEDLWAGYLNKFMLLYATKIVSGPRIATL
ncbi:hypothetical protein LBMAG50_03320 [Phycisphaerae bacterium]|jgi:hypothetical protein|nr:hypothetical protein LBMAG50_03320 [Phycisphaerae bacterium]